MPLLFFHLRTSKGLDLDNTGTDFPDLDAAYLDVCRAIPAMVKDLLRDGHDPLQCAFEIVDERGRQVMEVPFAERLTKTVSRPQSQVKAPSPDTAAVLDQILHAIARSQAESARLHRSVQDFRSILVRLTSLQNMPFIDRVAAHYGLPTMGGNAG